MKKMFQFVPLIAIVFAFSCKKDNYDPPTSQLSGSLVYQGTPIGVEYNSVSYQLFQYGFGRVGAIGSTIAPDGSYSQLLYDGDYKFTIPSGQGPFMWKTTSTGAPDSLSITVKGSQKLDIDVTPYYVITNPQMSATGSKVTATFGATKVITDANAKDIESVILLINKTAFVARDGNYNIAQTSMAGSSITDMNSISMSVDIPTFVPTQNYVYAAVGIKIAGVEDLLMSPIQKVTF